MEFLLTIIVIFVIFSWVFGKLFPRILAWYLTKKVKDMQGGTFGSRGFNASGFNASGFESYADQEIKKSKEQEGQVSVTRITRQEKIIDSSMGEYVEYESVEIKEEKTREN